MYRNSEDDEEENNYDIAPELLINTSEFPERGVENSISLESNDLESVLIGATFNQTTNTHLHFVNNNNGNNNLLTIEEHFNSRNPESKTARTQNSNVLNAPVNHGEHTRRLSLQVNNSGNPVRQLHGSDRYSNFINHTPLYPVAPPDGFRNVPKLPGGSRYFVTYPDEMVHHPLSATSRVHYIDPLESRPLSSYPWHEEHLATIGSPSSENLNRPSSSVRNRPVNSDVCHPRSTGIQRLKSPKSIWPQSQINSSFIPHLPPGGPDCMPGCGYSGLPCYICSVKMEGEHVEKSKQLRRSSFFTILQRREPAAVHRTRGTRTTASTVNEDDFSLNEGVLKLCLIRLNSCLKNASKKLRLPQSRLKQVALTCFIIYILLIIHIGITRLIRDYHF